MLTIELRVKAGHYGKETESGVSLYRLKSSGEELGVCRLMTGENLVKAMRAKELLESGKAVVTGLSQLPGKDESGNLETARAFFTELRKASSRDGIKEEHYTKFYVTIAGLSGWECRWEWAVNQWLTDEELAEWAEDFIPEVIGRGSYAGEDPYFYAVFPPPERGKFRPPELFTEEDFEQQFAFVGGDNAENLVSYSGFNTDNMLPVEQSSFLRARDPGMFAVSFPKTYYGYFARPEPASDFDLMCLQAEILNNEFPNTSGAFRVEKRPEYKGIRAVKII